MTDIRAALTRKFGPLPAWAWLTIIGVTVYVWRSRGGGATGGGATGAGSDTVAPEPAEPREPVTLSPGESVYDPGTGQLISTAPEQQPVEPLEPTPFTPVDMEPAPANAFEDPEVTSAKAPAAASVPKKKPGPLARAKAAVLTGRVGRINRQRLRRAGYSDRQIDYHAKRKTALQDPAGKRKAKPKPQHKPPKPVKHPTLVRSKPRNTGSVKHDSGRVKRTDPKPTQGGPRYVPRPRSKPAAPAPSRQRPRSVPRATPVTRQRPEPAHTTPRKKKKK